MSHTDKPGCSIDDALQILSGKFSSRTKVQRSVEVLKKNRYIQVGAFGADSCWVITNAGREALVIAPRNTTTEWRDS
jgi:hypothetical protein